MTLTHGLLAMHLLSISLFLAIGGVNLGRWGLAASGGRTNGWPNRSAPISLLPYGDLCVVAIIATGMVMLWSIGGPQGFSSWFQLQMAAALFWVTTYSFMRFRLRKFNLDRDLRLLPRIRLFMSMAMLAAGFTTLCAILAFGFKSLE